MVMTSSVSATQADAESLKLLPRMSFASTVASLEVEQTKPFKTRMCVFALLGRCRKGPLCTFAHEYEELTNPKSSLCPVFEQIGACHDPLCPLAHAFTEHAPLNKQLPSRVCRSWARSASCALGDHCRFNHC